MTSSSTPEPGYKAPTSGGYTVEEHLAAQQGQIDPVTELLVHEAAAQAGIKPTSSAPGGEPTPDAEPAPAETTDEPTPADQPTE